MVKLKNLVVFVSLSLSFVCVGEDTNHPNVYVKKFKCSNDLLKVAQDRRGDCKGDESCPRILERFCCAKPINKDEITNGKVSPENCLASGLYDKVSYEHRSGKNGKVFSYTTGEYQKGKKNGEFKRYSVKWLININSNKVFQTKLSKIKERVNFKQDKLDGISEIYSEPKSIVTFKDDKLNGSARFFNSKSKRRKTFVDTIPVLNLEFKDGNFEQLESFKVAKELPKNSLELTSFNVPKKVVEINYGAPTLIYDSKDKKNAKVLGVVFKGAIYLIKNKCKIDFLQKLQVDKSNASHYIGNSTVLEDAGDSVKVLLSRECGAYGWIFKTNKGLQGKYFAVENPKVFPVCDKFLKNKLHTVFLDKLKFLKLYNKKKEIDDFSSLINVIETLESEVLS